MEVILEMKLQYLALQKPKSRVLVQCSPPPQALTLSPKPPGINNAKKNFPITFRLIDSERKLFAPKLQFISFFFWPKNLAHLATISIFKVTKRF
jgi:hypothetical protein